MLENHLPMRNDAAWKTRVIMRAVPQPPITAIATCSSVKFAVVCRVVVPEGEEKSPWQRGILPAWTGDTGKRHQRFYQQVQLPSRVNFEYAVADIDRNDRL